MMMINTRLIQMQLCSTLKKVVKRYVE
jgi:hypothetical protein